MSKKINGGFPPIKYKNNEKDIKTSSNKKERFFSNAPKQNINIRQLLTTNNKELVIKVDQNKEDIMDVVEL
jgi:hypothetical protein